MKKMKKLFALVLALAMTLSLALTASAADTYTLTINDPNDGLTHTYEAYQIFSGDLVHQDGKDILSNIGWGESVTDGDALLEAFNTEYSLTLANAAAVAEWISNSVTSDSDGIDDIARLFGEYLGTPTGTSVKGESAYTISGLNAGYYLVKDKDGSLDADAHVAYTKFILRVIKDQTVTPKSDVPSVEKKINDTLGGTYTEHEDFDITDIAYYKWEGTLPSNLADYDEYFYKFIDNLPTGIVFEAIQQVYIEGHDGNVVHTFYDITDADSANDTLPAGITLTVNGKQVTRQADGSFVYTGTAISDAKSGQISLEFDDLFTSYANILNTHKIVVKYTALVTREVTYTVMVNDVVVEYSNNPNDPSGDGHGKTIPDEAYAFTFQINVDKYDTDNPEKKLEGAEFKLYYTRIENDTPVNYYALVVTEEMIAANEVINGIQLTDAELGQVYGWTTDETQASVLDTDANGYLGVFGLDADTYFLKETKAPAGYNLMEKPVQIDIIPTYSADGSSVTVEYKVDSVSQGTSNLVGVRNSAGSTLPVTGGIGTTIFYVAGGILVAAAVILLVTKKRMAK